MYIMLLVIFFCSTSRGAGSRADGATEKSEKIKRYNCKNTFSQKLDWEKESEDERKRRAFFFVIVVSIFFFSLIFM